MIMRSDHQPDPDDFGLDDEFPLGDGTAASGAMVTCPHCGEANEIALDAGSGSVQEYVEDCQVCCEPWQVRVVYGSDGEATVEVKGLDA